MLVSGPIWLNPATLLSSWKVQKASSHADPTAEIGISPRHSRQPRLSWPLTWGMARFIIILACPTLLSVHPALPQLLALE